MSDRPLFSSDYVFKTIKTEDVENIIKNVRKNRRTIKNDRGMWEEYCDHDRISIQSPIDDQSSMQIKSIESVPVSSASSQITPIRVRRLSDVEISDLVNRAITEVVYETNLTSRSQEIQNKPRRTIKRLERVGTNSPPSGKCNQGGDGAQNVLDENDKTKLEVIYNKQRPASGSKRFVNKLENITEIISQENFGHVRGSSNDKIQNTNDEKKIRSSKLTNHRTAHDNSMEGYPMVIKSNETIQAPMKKNSIIMRPEAENTLPESGVIDQSRLSDTERYEMMRLFNKKRRQLKKDSIAVDEALRADGTNIPEVFISNDSTTTKRSSIEMKTKQLGKITNYQQKSMNLIEQLRTCLFEIQNDGIDSKVIKFYSSSNSFLVNFSKNFLEKINSLIAEIPSINVSQQIYVINLKIYEAVLFYIKNKMFATYDHKLEKLDELVNVISTSILISFEFNIFNENDLVSQRFLQECRNLSACIRHIQRKKEIQFQKNPQPNLSKRFNPANSPRSSEQPTRYSMYGLNVKESKSYTKGKVQNSKNKTKSKYSSQSTGLNLVGSSKQSLEKSIGFGKKHVQARRGYSQKESNKKGSSKQGTRKESIRSRSQPESKVDLNDNRSEQSLKVIYPISDDFVKTVIENVDVDETELLSPYIAKPLTFTNTHFENLDMPSTYRYDDANDSDRQNNEIGVVKQECINAVMENLEQYMSKENFNQAQQCKNFEKHLQNLQSNENIEKPLINEFLRLELDDQKFKV